MSYIIYTKESIKIKAINEATREILNKIIEQIRCLTNGEGITYGALSYIKLTRGCEKSLKNRQAHNRKDRRLCACCGII